MRGRGLLRNGDTGACQPRRGVVDRLSGGSRETGGRGGANGGDGGRRRRARLRVAAMQAPVGTLVDRVRPRIGRVTFAEGDHPQDQSPIHFPENEHETVGRRRGALLAERDIELDAAAQPRPCGPSSSQGCHRRPERSASISLRAFSARARAGDLDLRRSTSSTQTSSSNSIEISAAPCRRSAIPRTLPEAHADPSGVVGARFGCAANPRRRSGGGRTAGRTPPWRQVRCPAFCPARPSA